MIPSAYVIQVLDTTNDRLVQWAPGLAVERQLVDDLCHRVAAKGVGLGRTTMHVVADVRAALEELLYELKSEIPPK